MDWFRNYMGRWVIKNVQEVSLVPEGGYPIDNEKGEDEPLWPKVNPYIPARIRIVSARGNGKTALSKKVTEAMVRADVYQYVDPLKDEIHFVSKNVIAPLTDKEKELMTVTLGLHMCPYKIVFDN